MPVLLRLQGVWRTIETQARRLLRVLLLWLGPVSADAGWELLLREGDDQSLVDEASAGRLFQRLGQRPILIAIGAANRGDPLKMIFRLIAVALLDLPKTVIVPGQDMVRIGFERALVPNLRELVVAELAIGIADQIRHIRVIVVTERLELVDRRGIILAVIDRLIGCAVTPDEGGVAEEGLFVGFLAAMG